MRTLGTIAETVEFRRTCRPPVVLVPTMGALHAGHAALVDAARRHAGASGTVVVSIFVNPTQFGPAEDFSKYPRTPGEDLRLCQGHGADAVFAPSAEEMYPPGDSTFVDETALSRGLCGSARPGHFRGVCTVVAKLFNILRPDAAIFGEKDYQQLAIIRRMVRDLFFGIEIIAHPTVREADGLALSSRNRYLAPDQRERASRFPAALQQAAKERRPSEILATAARLIEDGTGSRPQYVEVVDAGTLEPVGTLDRPAVLAAAVKIGETRLIDNVRLAPSHGKI
ncbi:MAG: pantoate--beta-alanine ligase [Chthoniobacterales bacterium]|nr:pantoate--beta-alanine ligase [Chthoniobacterales bacterium]